MITNHHNELKLSASLSMLQCEGNPTIQRTYKREEDPAIIEVRNARKHWLQETSWSMLVSLNMYPTRNCKSTVFKQSRRSHRQNLMKNITLEEYGTIVSWFKNDISTNDDKWLLKFSFYPLSQ